MTTRTLTRASALVLVVATLAGCSWRLETPPPDWPSPDAVTATRDAAAQREQDVIDAAALAGNGGTALGLVLAEIETAGAPERLDALGGLYVPYPDQSPTPTASPEPPRLLDAVSNARDGDLADALATETEDLALLLASAGLSHALAGWYADWVEDVIGAGELPVVATRPLPSEAVAGAAGPVPTSTSISSETLAELAVMHDQARYAYEVMAARADDEEERTQWLARRDLQTTRGEALAGLPGVADLRETTYTVLGDLTVDAGTRLDTAQALEMTAGETYLALLADSDKREWPWLLHAAFDAYAQAAAFGEPTAAEYPVPALPGVVVD